MSLATLGFSAMTRVFVDMRGRGISGCLAQCHQNFAAILCPPPSDLGVYVPRREVRAAPLWRLGNLRFHVRRTNRWPGNCFTSRFISIDNSVEDTFGVANPEAATI